MFLQENSEQKTLAEPESLGWTLFLCQGNSTHYWVQEVREEAIPAPQLTQQVPGSPLLLSAAGQKARRIPTLWRQMFS